MRNLPKPLRDARSTFELCVSRVSDFETASRLEAVASTIGQAESVYFDKATTSSLFGVVGAIFHEGDLAEEMVKLYTNILSKQNSKVRYIYDEIRAAAKRCPLCGQRDTNTLDHYLEKSRFPVYAVTPMNLVPACSQCNKLRFTARPRSASEQTLHPYFDHVDDQTWLQAQVLEIDPTAVIYTAVRPAAWSELKRDRVQSHFRALALGALYATHAATELTDMRHNLVRIGRGGSDRVKEELVWQAESRQQEFRNSWQGALYTALSASEWFCSGGYNCIPKPERSV